MFAATALAPAMCANPMTEHFRSFYGAGFWDSRILPMDRPPAPDEHALPVL